MLSDLISFIIKPMARQIAPMRISTIAGIIKATANFPALGRIAANATAPIAMSKPSRSSLFGTERTASTVRKVRHIKITKETTIAGAEIADIASISNLLSQYSIIYHVRISRRAKTGNSFLICGLFLHAGDGLT